MPTDSKDKTKVAETSLQEDEESPDNPGQYGDRHFAALLLLFLWGLFLLSYILYLIGIV